MHRIHRSSWGEVGGVTVSERFERHLVGRVVHGRDRAANDQDLGAEIIVRDRVHVPKARDVVAAQCLQEVHVFDYGEATSWRTSESGAVR